MDETITPQEGTNPEVEVLEETVVEETTETPTEVQVKTYSEDEFKQVLARAKRAEDEAKKLKSSPQNITNKTNSLSQEEVEVLLLKSQGMTDELIIDLKAVAKARGKGLFESQSDSIFIAIKKEKEDQVKAQKAKLPASRGSSTAKKEKEISSVGLTDEEHKQLWKERNER